MGKQSQSIRIENPHVGSFGTSRTINSQLWFINNKELDDRVLGYLAKYQEKYTVDIYAYVNSGSHVHLTAQFPKMNRSPFYRDLNARTAEAVRYTVPEFPGGPLFEHRYSEQALPLPEDIKEKFFYCALQPVLSGLCERISEYEGYNSFNDAIRGIEREFEVVDYQKYNAAKRYNRNVSKADFTTTYTLRYKRLPGYEEMTQKEYMHAMLKELEERRVKIVNERKAKGVGFLGPELLKRQIPGTPAKNPKKSKRNSYRPLVTSVCQLAKQSFLQGYFSVVAQYKKAVKRFLAGELNVIFPPGTYRPPSPVITQSG